MFSHISFWFDVNTCIYIYTLLTQSSYIYMYMKTVKFEWAGCIYIYGLHRCSLYLYLALVSAIGGVLDVLAQKWKARQLGPPCSWLSIYSLLELTCSSPVELAWPCQFIYCTVAKKDIKPNMSLCEEIALDSVICWSIAGWMPGMLQPKRKPLTVVLGTWFISNCCIRDAWLWAFFGNMWGWVPGREPWGGPLQHAADRCLAKWV